MRRECLAGLIALLVGGVGAAHADLRGETVCGIPPTEAVLVLFSVSWADDEPAERWVCGPDGCDEYQGAPEVTEDEYVCDVLVEPWDGIYDGRLYRLGPLGYPPLDPDEEIDPDTGPSDARYHIDDVLSGGGSAAPPGNRCVYIGGGDLLEGSGWGRRAMSRMLREAGPEETERLIERLQKVRGSFRRQSECRGSSPVRRGGMSGSLLGRGLGVRAEGRAGNRAGAEPHHGDG